METTLHSSAMGIAKPLPDADSWQIITGDKEFKDVQKYLESVGISHNGFQYNVVAVFGSQSTGKSTLLNKLFGTNFATMDTISRQQTTKGIWLSRAHNSNIIVMDVEGTDGRERGDDQDFERKSALFSIATSEVLVVNMWESQVGLYNGANMGLLKTVFEVNLQLFQKERSLLLFVIRDHIGVTPMDNLQQTIEADLGKIWISLIKPPGTEHTSISDYFDLEFVGLPHKLLMSDAFDQEVLKLRHRFISPDKEQLIFQQVYHKKIPADGFSTYAKGIWEAIEANKDLDLPSQQELLAQFRCDEIASAALAVFEQQIRTTEDGMKIGVVYSNLGSEMSLALSNTLAAFDLEASRYHNSVYTKKRSELLASLDARLIVLYKSQLSSLRKQCAAEYVASVVKEISNIKTYDFGEITNSRQTDALSAFQAEARSCCIEPMPWSFAEDEELLTQDLKVLTFQLRTEEIKKLHDRLYRELKQKFEESITNEFSTLDKLLWDRVLDTCVSTELNNITNVFSERLSAFDLSFPEQEESIKQLQRRAWKLLKARVSEETSESHLLLRLREHFEDSFKFTSEGIPVVWKAGDNIDGSYRSAREGTLSIIPLFSRIQRSNGETPELPSIDDEDFDPDSILKLNSATKQADLTTRFKKIADAVYVDAKRSTVSSVASIPLYFYGLLLVLGWNELMTLLRNPIYVVTIVFSALIAYSVYTLNLSGPVEQVARSMLGTMFDILKDKLRSALEISQESVPELLQSGELRTTVKTSKREEEIELNELSLKGKKHK